MAMRKCACRLDRRELGEGGGGRKCVTISLTEESCKGLGVGWGGVRKCVSVGLTEESWGGGGVRKCVSVGLKVG